ncbi:hypothetical protein LOZ12_004733 [Ophidiomyces ophidiicola]|uniref:Uncharacterized protein n=1 Tax=Ophidiomyces ophidiicola TaxID=1387563 RepID=A0ACB8URY3_9EURO|nr:hypothetical protein LOZ64_005070 [Ophidiomyces ophidiicola]KAI1969467.1 hypothetical protein LOZ56_004407 [Ophidiomyces ophidiicola]KAI2000332.1 hypothetical protein LOZ50_006024 [Ophidiomyces ophidiicola]KAI2022686.1 hypothetical protein LOZ46_001827 [Ophidiomyces ophidiicola]KAI2025895.1 hypothetical protein LOZ48_005290 [Ophidiomyces ophidiicola]
MSSSVFWFFGLGAASVVIFFISQRRTVAHHASEPPLIPSKIPFALFGMDWPTIRCKGVYQFLITIIDEALAKIYIDSDKSKLPIFTINLLSSKVYVVTSPALIAAAQRKSRVISFEPFPTIAAERLAGIKGPRLEALREPRRGGGGLNNRVMHVMSPTLLNEGLDQMNSRMVATLKEWVDGLSSVGDGGHRAFDLYAWCRQILTIASTDAVYGPLNPYRPTSIQDAAWTYEQSAAIFLLNIAPRLIANKAWRARETVVAALEAYYRNNGHFDSSEMTYRRWKVQHDSGASPADIARLEALLAFGLLANSVPSTFWLLVEICSRPSLLAEVREELIENALHVDEKGVHLLDLGGIQAKCALFLSVFQETLRLRSNATVTRKIYEDVMLNDEYLLKAGSLLQMPAARLARDGSTWGAGGDGGVPAADFDPRRFMKKKEGSGTKQAVTGYLAFGAAPDLCPGRHFATGEILALVGMMLLRYDIQPENGRWSVSKLNPHDLPATVTPPTMGAFFATARPRADYAAVEWGFRVVPGKGRYGLITG